jgi:hypothetical protein
LHARVRVSYRISGCGFLVIGYVCECILNRRITGAAGADDWPPRGSPGPLEGQSGFKSSKFLPRFARTRLFLQATGPGAPLPRYNQLAANITRLAEASEAAQVAFRSGLVSLRQSFFARCAAVPSRAFRMCCSGRSGSDRSWLTVQCVAGFFKPLHVSKDVKYPQISCAARRL